MNQETTSADFYVVAYEPGAENPSLPTWASRHSNPAGLTPDRSATVHRENVDDVPGAFQLLNVLSESECDSLLSISEKLGYLPDAAVSLPRSIRHNHNVVWVVDEDTDGIIWTRIADSVSDISEDYFGKQPLGINARFRFYRYQKDDFFKPHTDGAWPGSRVVKDQLVTNAYPDRFSQMSFLIFLSDDFQGGATRFQVMGRSNDTQFGENKMIDVRTPKGGVLCFPHGMHPWHCVHSSEPITQGSKYMIRTDLLFEI